MSKTGQIAVTGIGLSCPAGDSPDACFEALSKGEPLFREVALFGGAAPTIFAGCAQGSPEERGIGRRLLKKLDRFTVLSLLAAQGALSDAAIPYGHGRDDRVGMVIGNVTGGWSFVEPMMYGLNTEGMSAINSYVATAWFPAAPQGEISILLGLGGYSKTVSADRISAGFALAQAIASLRAGRTEAMLAGGAEAPLCALVANAHLARGLPETGAGLLGEGACLLALESAESALARRRAPYAMVAGLGWGPTLDEADRACLSSAGVSPAEVDQVLLDAPGDPALVEQELNALQRVFGARDDLLVSAPKTMYGDTLGAALALDMASACLSLQKQVALPSARGFSPQGSWPFRFVLGSAEPRPLRHILAHGRDADGRGLSVLLARV